MRLVSGGEAVKPEIAWIAKTQKHELMLLTLASDFQKSWARLCSQTHESVESLARRGYYVVKVELREVG